MKAFFQYSVMIFAFLIIGPSSHAQEESPASPDTALMASTGDAISHSVQGQENSLLLQARSWTPRFIETGITSGIMIEFTGMKKNKRVNARHASIELLRYPLDATSKAIPLGTIINDLGQAFFKVAPGKYLVHQTNAWADKTYIRDVEVQDGNYSTILINIFNPWLTKAR